MSELIVQPVLHYKVILYLVHLCLGDPLQAPLEEYITFTHFFQNFNSFSADLQDKHASHWHAKRRATSLNGLFCARQIRRAASHDVAHLRWG